MPARRTFASDNNSGAHPAVLAAIAAANEGHVHAYGDDPYTARAVEVLRGHLGGQADVFFVFNGTGANVVSLSALLKPYQAVICPDTAHIATDECGAPERFTGSKLIGVPTPDGKLRPADITAQLGGMGVEHHVQPRVVSISQVSEMGTVYTCEEVRALGDTAHEAGLLLHMDGARLANAAAALGVPIRAFTTDAGVDVLSFGGTKNGMLFGEAVCFLTPGLVDDGRFVRKNAGQLPSKMRFAAAQFTALYEGDLWLELASHANAMARRLADGAASVPGVEIAQVRGANEVFARVPRAHIPALQEIADFYIWNEERSEVRWVASFDTTEEDVDRFLGGLRGLLGA
jgi:threonine aldolase